MSAMDYISGMTSPRHLPLLMATLLLIASPVRAQGMDRLFYSPGERAVLDAQRHQSPLPGAGTDTITVNGLVTRSSGKSTVWVNGTPRNEDHPGNGVEILDRQAAGGHVTLRPATTDQAVDLKVGQTLEGATGKVREVYDSPQNKEAVEEVLE